MYLNEIGDVVSDVFLILPFAHLAELRPFWIWIIVVLAIVSEMAGVMAAMTGSARRYDGPMGKSDRAVVFGAAGLYAGLGGSIPPAFMAIVASLLAATVVHRVLRGIHAAS
jgi:CDP-diacylglycerol--glycerol-3-phosphate 3-phosphatidyltransferase